MLQSTIQLQSLVRTALHATALELESISERKGELTIYCTTFIAAGLLIYGKLWNFKIPQFSHTLWHTKIEYLISNLQFLKDTSKLQIELQTPSMCPAQTADSEFAVSNFRWLGAAWRHRQLELVTQAWASASTSTWKLELKVRTQNASGASAWLRVRVRVDLVAVTL